jgi:hypothetical protein
VTALDRLLAVLEHENQGGGRDRLACVFSPNGVPAVCPQQLATSLWIGMQEAQR